MQIGFGWLLGTVLFSLEYLLEQDMQSAAGLILIERIKVGALTKVVLEKVRE